MRIFRSTLMAGVALAIACVSATAAPKADTGDQKGAACDSIASVVINTPFQLTQQSTTKVSDCVSRSTYMGTGTVTINGCNNGVVQTVPVTLQLSTQTTLNACGDGFTEGQFALTNTTTNQSITGTLWAVNHNFGELTGTLDGALRYKLDKFLGSPTGMNPNVTLRMRAAFSAAFVQDQNGNYTLVNVSDAHGVIYTPNKDARNGHGDD